MHMNNSKHSETKVTKFLQYFRVSPNLNHTDRELVDRNKLNIRMLPGQDLHRRAHSYQILHRHLWGHQSIWEEDRSPQCLVCTLTANLTKYPLRKDFPSLGTSRCGTRRRSSSSLATSSPDPRQSAARCWSASRPSWMSPPSPTSSASRTLRRLSESSTLETWPS